MAYLDHVDPGNSGGSVPTPPSIGSNIIITPPVFCCQECGAEFPNPAELSEHKVDKHPLRRPYMFLNKQELTQAETIIYEPIRTEQVKLVNVQQIMMDDESYDSPDRFMADLVSSANGRRHIKLTYQGYSVNFNIVFEYLSEQDAATVESLFYQTFTDSELSTDHVYRFDRLCREQGCMTKYAGGLGCYIYGLLAKERNPTSSLKFEDYPAKFGEALDKLSPLNRPLAQGIVSAIYFARNQFDLILHDSIVPQIYMAGQFMRTGIFSDYRFGGTETLKKFPTDKLTEQLIAFTTQGSKTRNSMADDMESYIKRSLISDEDNSKAAMALLSYYTDKQDKEKMASMHRKIRFNPHFSDIANQILGGEND
jgi:hypothetical protein